MMMDLAGSIRIGARIVDVVGFAIMWPLGGPRCKSRWDKGSGSLNPGAESAAVAETLLEADSMPENRNTCESQESSDNTTIQAEARWKRGRRQRTEGTLRGEADRSNGTEEGEDGDREGKVPRVYRYEDPHIATCRQDQNFILMLFM